MIRSHWSIEGATDPGQKSELNAFVSIFAMFLLLFLRSYPVPNNRNQDLYKKYKDLADKEHNVTCKCSRKVLKSLIDSASASSFDNGVKVSCYDISILS